jgi:D-sedoheptulose 7-phosphate isomerase
MSISVQYAELMQKSLDLFPHSAFEQLMMAMEKCLREGRQIFIMGNGGSAATASHFCCDINKGCSHSFKDRFRMICLNDNVSTMLAYANDTSFELIFAEQLKNFARPGDLVIGISGSGNSPNVVNALTYAASAGCTTAGLTGFNGGKVAEFVAINVHIPVDDMQVTEDMHSIVMHMTMKHFMAIQCKPQGVQAAAHGD